MRRALFLTLLLPLASAAPAVAQRAALNSNPDSARLVTSDITLFWDAVDHAPPDSLAAYLQREYLDRASVGVRDFTEDRIQSAAHLAKVYTEQQAKYQAARATGMSIRTVEPAIRAAFHKLNELYPDAVFPDVYFVVGGMNSGGTTSDHGLLIGAEMYADPARLAAIVAHELIHFQQRYDNRTLLQHSFFEGSADFIGELISGQQINVAAHIYGRAHEHELWTEFKQRLADTTYTGWMYGSHPPGRPNDLGYFIGYRIAEAYYNRMPDKRRAIRGIIAPSPFVDLLKESGYDP